MTPTSAGLTFAFLIDNIYGNSKTWIVATPNIDHNPIRNQIIMQFVIA